MAASIPRVCRILNFGALISQHKGKLLPKMQSFSSFRDFFSLTKMCSSHIFSADLWELTLPSRKSYWESHYNPFG